MVRMIERSYAALAREHFAAHRQMLFLAGPRQVGKSTVCHELAGGAVLNYDRAADRAILLKGAPAVEAKFDLNQLREMKPTVGFDELHKLRTWKSFLKGFFDSHGDTAHIVVTGSSRLDVYRRGGDSLMGRYFLMHMHPLSVGELVRPVAPDKIIAAPQNISDLEWSALYEHGGFPEPFLKRDRRFSLRWQSLRRNQIVREEIRDLTKITDVARIEILAALLQERSAQSLIYSNLASDLAVSVDTVRRWVDALSSLYFGFMLRPWSRSLTNSLRKEPKWYLRDWSEIENPGHRAETFIACHLLKAVEMWNDTGLGRFELRYVRDKAGREVDFLIIQSNKPWLLVEVKNSDTQVSDALRYYQEQLKAPHALQVVVDLPFVSRSYFESEKPLVVPARTFLSQLP